MRIIIIIASALLSACSGITSSYNPSVFDYQINSEAIAEKPLKKIVLANTSLGAPVRNYLLSPERRVRKQVADYLEDNGYELAPVYEFENAWKQAIRNFGNPYDPTTGRIDSQTWKAVLVDTLSSLRERTDIEAIVFADLIEHDVAHNIGMAHVARWYGVDRKVAIEGAGEASVPNDFDWNQQVKAASLVVTIFSVKPEQLFSSRGGLDTLEGIDSRSRSSAPGFVRRAKLLQRDEYLEQGISIAFHPFIVMEDYPGTIDGAETEIEKAPEQKKE